MAILYLFICLVAFSAVGLALIAVHELDHLLVGRLVGLTCRRFKVGPFQLARISTSGDRERWLLSLSEGWQYGLVECVVGPDLGTRAHQKSYCSARLQSLLGEGQSTRFSRSYLIPIPPLWQFA